MRIMDARILKLTIAVGQTDKYQKVNYDSMKPIKWTSSISKDSIALSKGGYCMFRPCLWRFYCILSSVNYIIITVY